MSGDGEDSVTRWIVELRGGDEEAAEKLWRRYFGRLTGLIRRHLPQVIDPLLDEEDVALEGLDILFQGLKKGQFEELSDRNQFWRLLVVVTVRNALARLRHKTRQKRGGTGLRRQPVDGLLDPGPSPDLEAILGEEFLRLLVLLRDEQLRRIALLKMDGHTDEEIAEEIGVVRRTVVRKLGLIRRIWEDEVR